MKQKFVVNHVIRQTEIPASLDGWVTNTLFFDVHEAVHR
jgi:hypothetical protein